MLLTRLRRPPFALLALLRPLPPGRDILREIARTPDHIPSAANRDDQWGRDQGSGIYVGGRLVLNLWRILRSEVNLQSHAFEASAAAVLRKRCVTSRAPSIFSIYLAVVSHACEHDLRCRALFTCAIR